MYSGNVRINVVELIKHLIDLSFFFFFNDTATTEIYTLSLHDALPICGAPTPAAARSGPPAAAAALHRPGDRKSTRLNSSHLVISYAVFCLKKKKNIIIHIITFYCESPHVVMFSLLLTLIALSSVQLSS